MSSSTISMYVPGILCDQLLCKCQFCSNKLLAVWMVMKFCLPLCFCRVQGQVQTQPAEAGDQQLGLQLEDTVPNVLRQAAAGRVARHPDSTATVSLDSGGPTDDLL